MSQLLTKAGRLPVKKLSSFTHLLRTIKVLVHQNFKSLSTNFWKTAVSILILIFKVEKRTRGILKIINKRK
jgi:hypothetical protein